MLYVSTNIVEPGNILNHALNASNSLSKDIKRIETDGETVTVDCYKGEGDFVYDIEKENKVKNFYNQYEHLIGNRSKLRFFYQVVKSGSLNLIEFAYKEKKIKNNI